MNRLSFLAVILSSLAFSCGHNPEPQVFFAGGFTSGDEPAMALFELDSKGDATLLKQIEAGPSPAYFTFSKDHNLIYAMNEVNDFKGSQGGGITTLAYDPLTSATELRGEISIPFGGACHISLSADSGSLFVASYGSGSVAVVKLDEKGIPAKVTDTILYVTEPPVVSHPHMISHDPEGKFVYLTDLGLNRLVVFSFDPVNGRLFQVENGVIPLAQGSGPRHFTFSKDGSSLYVINETGSSVMHFSVGESGIPVFRQTISTLSDEYNGKNSCAEIVLDKNEKFLYGSNRGENTIVVFSVGEDGYLTLAGRSTCGGDWPRNFVIDPSGKFLLSGNQRSDNISVFRINQANGLPEGPVSSIGMKAPACIEFWNK